MAELVLYYRPGCPHCDVFKPVFVQAQARIRAAGAKPRLVNTSEAASKRDMDKLQEPLRGVPHVVLFKADGSQVVFDAERVVDALVAFVQRELGLRGGYNLQLRGGAAVRLLDTLRWVSASK